MATGLDRLVDRVTAHRQPLDGHHGAAPVVLVHAVKLRDRPLGHQLAIVQTALDDDLVIGRHRQPRLGAHHPDRASQQPAGRIPAHRRRAPDTGTPRSAPPDGCRSSPRSAASRRGRRHVAPAPPDDGWGRSRPSPAPHRGTCTVRSRDRRRRRPGRGRRSRRRSRTGRSDARRTTGSAAGPDRPARPRPPGRARHRPLAAPPAEPARRGSAPGPPEDRPPPPDPRRSDGDCPAPRRPPADPTRAPARTAAPVRRRLRPAAPTARGAATPAR